MFFFSAISFQVECEPVSFASVHGSLEHAPNYILHIYPPAILHNYLPYNIRYASSQVSTSNSSLWNFQGLMWDFKTSLIFQQGG